MAALIHMAAASRIYMELLSYSPSLSGGLEGRGGGMGMVLPNALFSLHRAAAGGPGSNTHRRQ
jgi:hypothetical protein